MEAKAETQRIAIPCEECPLRAGSGNQLRKISFSPSGIISYIPPSECGVKAVTAEGLRADRVHDAIIACKEPAVDTVRAQTLAGRLGFQFEEQASCPAFDRVDPTSSRQVSDYFEGEY